MGKKLISLFMVSLVSAMLLIAALVAGYYTLARRNLQVQNERSADYTLEDVVNRIQAEFIDDIDTGSVIANYDEIIRFMSGDLQMRLRMRDSVRSLLTTQINLQRGLRFACAYTYDGSRMYVGPATMRDSEWNAGYELCSRILADYDLRDPYRGGQISRCYNGRDHVYYAILIPVYPTGGVRYLGSLVLLYNGENIQDLLPSNAETSLLVTGDGEILAQSDAEIGERWRAGTTGSLLSRRVEPSGWEAFAFPSDAALQQTMAGLARLCVVVLIGTVIAFSVLVMIQYRSIVGPVITIAHEAADVGAHPDREMRIAFGVNEFDELTRSINAMLASQRRMSDEMLAMKSRVYEEQISFLQSQINPHFLYNCLESLRGMAGAGMVREIREMASGIAAIYRYGGKENPFATLSEEYACASTYAKVLNLCYRSAYHVAFDIDEAVGALPVPRMILQPLIENAILHGFVGEKRSSGHVDVCARADGDALLLTVEDDGVGVGEAQLAEWNSGWERWSEVSTEHIGLTNVMRRVWLLYGEGAQVRFFTGAQRGLRIHFRFIQQPDPSSVMGPKEQQNRWNA